MRHLQKSVKQILKKNAGSFLKSLLVVSLVSCKPPHKIPSTEICVHNDDNSAECTDLRLPEGERSYTNESLENYLCTNPQDYQTMSDYMFDIREKLIRCEYQLRRK